MIDDKTIIDRITVLDEDIQKVNEQLIDLEKKKVECKMHWVVQNNSVLTFSHRLMMVARLLVKVMLVKKMKMQLS